MTNRTLEFVLQTKKQGDAVTELTEEHKKLADTLRNKVSLAMSESELAARKLAAAQEKLTASSDPEEQAKLSHEVNKARVAMDNAQAKADKYSDELNGLYDNSKKAGDSQQGLGLSLTDLKSGYDLAVEGVEILAQAYDALIAKSAAWGDSMGDLAQVTGQSVEDTSQMAATLELLGVSTEKFTGIIKAMTKEGLQLNMETLVRLSKEYQAIKDPVKQNEFLFKNFGRAAEDMAEVMGKSTEELIQMGNAAKYSGKVIGEEAANQAERLNIQMAILQQKVEGAGIALGNVLIPWLNGAIDGAYNLVKAQQALVIQFQLSTGMIDQQTAATKAAALANGDLFAAWHDVTVEAETTTANTEALDTAQRNLAISTEAARWAAIAEAEAQKQAAEAKYIADGAARTLTASFQELNAQMFFNQAAAGLSVEAQTDLARSLGLINEESYTTLTSLQQLREKYDTNRDGAISAAEGAAQYAREARNLAAAINEIPTQHTVNLVINRESRGENFDLGIGQTRAIGGPVREDTPYIVGERGPELFVPEQNGTIVPNVGGNVSTTNYGGHTVQIMPGAIVLHGGGDTRGVADALLQQLGAAVRQAVQGGHAYVGAT